MQTFEKIEKSRRTFLMVQDTLAKGCFVFIVLLEALSLRYNLFSQIALLQVSLITGVVATLPERFYLHIFLCTLLGEKKYKKKFFPYAQIRTSAMRILFPKGRAYKGKNYIRLQTDDQVLEMGDISFVPQKGEPVMRGLFIIVHNKKTNKLIPQLKALAKDVGIELVCREDGENLYFYLNQMTTKVFFSVHVPQVPPYAMGYFFRHLFQ